MYSFNYSKPDTIEAAREMMRSAEDGIYLAGGQTLIPAMKQRLSAPTDVIDLSSIGELTDIDVSDGRVRLGALVKHADVAGSDAVRSAIPALADLAAGIGDAQVRNRGTIGGSVANNDPAADIQLRCWDWGLPCIPISGRFLRMISSWDCLRPRSRRGRLLPRWPSLCRIGPPMQNFPILPRDMRR